jgi:hypothetical protein
LSIFNRRLASPLTRAGLARIFRNAFKKTIRLISSFLLVDRRGLWWQKKGLLPIALRGCEWRRTVDHYLTQHLLGNLGEL